MSRSCSICTNPQRDAIDAAHQRGESNRRIASQYGLTEASVRRHCASHVTELPEAKRRDASVPHARKQGENIPQEVRPGTQAAFLAAFVELGNEIGACRAIQIDPGTIDWWEEHDTDFSFRYARAKAERNDVIRGEMYRRAIKGVPEPVVSGGKVMTNADGSVMTVQKYSDALIGKLASAWMRSEFADKQQVEISGKDGGPIQSQQTVALDVRGMTPEQLAALRQVLEAGQ